MADDIDRQAVRAVAEKLKALNEAIVGAGHLGIRIELQAVERFGDCSSTYVVAKSFREEHINPAAT